MEEIKKKKKENSTELQKPSIEAEVYNNKKNWLNIHIYKYTHNQNQNSPTKIKYNRLTWWTNEIKNYIYQTKLIKAHTGKQN